MILTIFGGGLFNEPFYNYQNNPTGNNLGNNFFCLEKKMLADIGSESKLKYKKKIYSSSLSIVTETAWI